MAATRLSDSQKQQIVDGFREGRSSGDLANAFGCSPNTITRLVKGALTPEDYEQLKRERQRPAAPVRREAVEPVADLEPSVVEAEAEAEVVVMAETEVLAGAEEVGEPETDGPAVLPIDDADDFGDDEDEDDLEEGVDDGDEEDLFMPVAVLHTGIEPQGVCEATPLCSDDLPASAYLLVDKTVELQPRPLREFTELGRLPEDEEDRQALAVFINPRQAKRQCGRSQRVIKIPDTSILERTAPYLLAQGISRVVIEGTLYSLPGS